MFFGFLFWYLTMIDLWKSRHFGGQKLSEILTLASRLRIFTSFSLKTKNRCLPPFFTFLLASIAVLVESVPLKSLFNFLAKYYKGKKTIIIHRKFQSFWNMTLYRHLSLQRRLLNKRFHISNFLWAQASRIFTLLLLWTADFHKRSIFQRFLKWLLEYS